MMWKLDGQELDPKFLGSLEPERVLFEYEGPRSYVARDAAGGLLFAHQCGEAADRWRYAVVPFSTELLDALESGQLDLRSALGQPWLWIVDIGEKGHPVRCVRSSLSAIPEECLPRPGVMLYPDHDPAPEIFPVGRIEQSILLIRGRRVIIDADLAGLYGVTTKRLNEQVKRNADRFPDDFVFVLTESEKQQVVANCDHLHKLRFSPNLPHAFTEHGTLMAANLLKSPLAAKVSVYVVRAFAKLREFLSDLDVSVKSGDLEAKLQDDDEQVIALIDAIR
jgi:hypothetical protein